MIMIMIMIMIQKLESRVLMSTTAVAATAPAKQAVVAMVVTEKPAEPKPGTTVSKDMFEVVTQMDNGIPAWQAGHRDLKVSQGVLDDVNGRYGTSYTQADVAEDGWQIMEDYLTIYEKGKSTQVLVETWFGGPGGTTGQLAKTAWARYQDYDRLNNANPDGGGY